MSDQGTRYSALLARCTEEARAELETLHRHPLLPEIIDALEAIEGPLLDRHVEDSFANVTFRHATLNDRGL